MNSAERNGDPTAIDSPLLRDEETWVVRLAWGSAIAFAGLNLAILAFLLLSQASQPWHYVADTALLVTIMASGLALAAYNRHRHLEPLRRLQARLLMRAVELQEVATRDDLTQLHNRRHFYQRLEKSLEQARVARRPLALLIVDVDDLKGINDNYGHLVGDAALKKLAQIMTRHVRTGDEVARLGGDEFGIIMPDADKRGAFGLAYRLWRELEMTPIYEEKETSFHLDVSIGVSGYPWGGDDVEQMLHWADTNMYANKLSRRLPVPPIPNGEVSPNIETAPSDYT